MVIIKKLAPPQSIHYGIQVIIDDIVSGDGWQIAGALCKNASFQAHNVVFREQFVSLGNMASKARLVHSLSDFLLDFVDCILEAFGHCVHPQRVHVEAVRFSGKYEEGHDSFIGFAFFELQRNTFYCQSRSVELVLPDD